MHAAVEPDVGAQSTREYGAIVAKRKQSAGSGAGGSRPKPRRSRGPPPVHLWNPPFCGDIDMRIAADGTWFYLGSPIGRPPLVQAVLLDLAQGPRALRAGDAGRAGRHQGRRRAVPRRGDARRSGERIGFRTQVDDFVWVDAEHPLRFEPGAAEGVKPYVRVRGDLWALVKRRAVLRSRGARRRRARGGRGLVRRALGRAFFPMRPAAEIEGL